MEIETRILSLPDAKSFVRNCIYFGVRVLWRKRGKVYEIKATRAAWSHFVESK